MSEGLPSIVVKWNNAAGIDPCVVCGQRTRTEVGPELFLEGTYLAVCHDCGRKYAPGVTLLVERYRRPLLKALEEGE
jgi:transcription elongation factor Elf1